MATYEIEYEVILNETFITNADDEEQAELFAVENARETYIIPSSDVRVIGIKEIN